MSFSFNALIRGFIYLTIVTSLTAIGINRLAPQATHFRILKRSTIVPVNGYHFRSYDRLPRIFDPETGRLAFANMEGVDSFDNAACSPWENDQGRSDVVGRWLGRKGGGICRGFGLARFKFPGGHVLDRVKLSVMPVSAPCFDPDRPSNVLFASGNGRLYRYTFAGDPGASSGSETEEVAPTPVTWRTATAGEQPVAINDPIWPTDPRLKGRLIASFMFSEKTSTGRLVLRSRLGWLRLDHAGTEVVESGLLIEQDPTTTTDLELDETVPTVGLAEDGVGLTLAYLTHAQQERGWTLCIAPIQVRDSGIPLVEGPRVRVVVSNRSHVVPIFSANGRSLYSLQHSDPKPEGMELIAIPPLEQQSAAALASQSVLPERITAN